MICPYMDANLTYKLENTSAGEDLHFCNSLRERNTHGESTKNITFKVSDNPSNACTKLNVYLSGEI